MKKHPWFVGFCLLALAGCAQSGTTVREQTRRDSGEDREAYQKEVRHHLDELDRERPAVAAGMMGIARSSFEQASGTHLPGSSWTSDQTL